MDNLRGISLMVLSMAFFAIDDVFIKFLSVTMPVSQMLAVVGAAGAALFAIWARFAGHRVWSPDFFARPVLLRNICEVLGTIFFLSALALAPLSSVSAILQATPLAVTLGAALFLGDDVGWRRWTAIIVGFCGVLLIIRPGMDAFEFSSLLAVGAAIGLGLRDVATRATPKRVSSLQLATYAYAVVTIAGLVMMPFGAPSIMPNATEAWLLIGALLSSMAGYYFITASMRVGIVAVVTPFRYTRLLFALMLAATFFGERPDVATLIGAGIVISAGLYSLARERRLYRMRAQDAQFKT